MGRLKHRHLSDCRGSPIQINEETVSVGTWNIDGKDYPLNVHIMRNTTFMDYVHTNNYSRITIDSEHCLLHENPENWYTVMAYDGVTQGEFGMALTVMTEETFRREYRHFTNVSVWDNTAERVEYARDVQVYNDGYKVSMARIAPFFGLKKVAEETPCQCSSRIRDLASDPELLHYTLVDHLVPYVLSQHVERKDGICLNLNYHKTELPNYGRDIHGDIIYVKHQWFKLIATQQDYRENMKAPSVAYMDNTNLNKCRRALDETGTDSIYIPRRLVDIAEATPNVSAETLVYEDGRNSELSRNISLMSDNEEEAFGRVPIRILAGLNDTPDVSDSDSDSSICDFSDTKTMCKWLRSQGQLDHLAGLQFKVWSADDFTRKQQATFLSQAMKQAKRSDEEEIAKTRTWSEYFCTKYEESKETIAGLWNGSGVQHEDKSIFNRAANKLWNQTYEAGWKNCESLEDHVLNQNDEWRRTYGRDAPIITPINAALSAAWLTGLVSTSVVLAKDIYDYTTDNSLQLRRQILEAHYEKVTNERIFEQACEEWNAQIALITKHDLGLGVTPPKKTQGQKRGQAPTKKKGNKKEVDLDINDFSEGGRRSRTEKHKIAQKEARDYMEYERKDHNKAVVEKFNADRRCVKKINSIKQQHQAGLITADEAQERIEKKVAEEFPQLNAKSTEPTQQNTGHETIEEDGQDSCSQESAKEASFVSSKYYERGTRKIAQKASTNATVKERNSLSFGQAIKLNPFWCSKSSSKDKNLEPVIIFQPGKAIKTERPVAYNAVEEVGTAPTAEDRLKIAKRCFSSAKTYEDYVVVSMPNGYCMPFAMVCAGMGWPENAQHKTSIEDCVKILQTIASTTPYEPWITSMTGEAGHICLAMSYDTYYNALSMFAEVAGDGVYINREKLSEAKGDEWTYNKHVGFELSINGNASDTLLDTITRDGLNVRIQDKTRNVKIMAHGGHQTARRLVDAMHVRNWNQVLTAICTGKYDRVVDVGSKFASMRSRLVKASLRYVAETPDFTVKFKPHRMNDNDYNKLYRNENLDNYREKIKHQPQATICYQGKYINFIFEDVDIEAVTIENTYETDIVVMTDAHYYNLDNPMNGLKCYSGLAFPQVAGIYRYSDELIIRVTGGDTTSKIEMVSNSNATSYLHPNVNVKHASKIASWEELSFMYGQTTDPVFVVGVMLNPKTNLVDWTLEKLKRLNDNDARLLMACRTKNIDFDIAKAYKPCYLDYDDQWRKNTAAYSNNNPLANKAQLTGHKYYRYLDLPNHIRYRFSLPTRSQAVTSACISGFIAAVVLLSNFKVFECKPWLFDLLEHCLRKKDSWFFRLALSASSFVASSLGGLIVSFCYNHARNTIKAATQNTPYILSEKDLINLGIVVGCVAVQSPPIIESQPVQSYKHLLVAETKYNKGTRPMFEEHEDDSKKACAGIIDLGQIESKQNLRLRRGQNRYLKVEKPSKNFEYNDKLVSLDLNMAKAHDLYERSKAEAQKPAASFVYHDGEGFPYSQHCWDSRSIVNMFYAFFDRQVGTMLKPAINVVEHFTLFCQAQILSIRKLPVAAVSKTFSAWLRDHEDWSVSKKLFYKENYKLQMSGSYPTGYFKNRFDITVKNLEMYYCAQAEVDECVVAGLKDRPRSIMTPHESLCGVITYSQHIVFEMLKRNYAEFVHGENSIDFWNRTHPEIHRKLRKPIAFSLDGGSHDSHQHSSLIRAVDHQLWMHFKPEIAQLLIQQGAINPDRLLQDIYRILLSTKARIDFRHAKEYLGHAIVDGTVFSGSPTLTTLGNTMRVMYYYKFILHCAGIHDYVLRVAGDDAVIWVDEDQADIFEDALHCFTSTTKLPQSKGLGQMLEYTRTPGHVAEFCSKMLVCDPTNYSTGQWVRKPSSLLFKGLSYKGTQEAFKDPKVYSYVWGACLATESQGPIYREYAALRMKMGLKTGASLHKKQAILCKNDYEPTLDPWYIANFSFWYGCSEDQTLRFLTLLQQLDSLPEVEIGLSLPRPDEL